MENQGITEKLNNQQTREAMLTSLKEVEDPEIHINIVDLGLVYRVDIADDQKKVEIDFTLTTPGCPLADVIEDNIAAACKKVLPAAEVVTQLVWTPMWNVDFMSEDARLELGFPV